MKCIKYIAAAVCCMNVCDANIIEKLLDYKSNKINIHGMQMKRVESKLMPGIYYYKVVDPTRTKTVNQPAPVKHTGMTPSEIETARIAVAQHEAEIAAAKIKKPEQAERESRQLVYGEKGVMQDPHVLEAWRAAEEAQKRLQEHREYMERVRESKTLIEQSKKHDAGLEVASPEAS